MGRKAPFILFEGTSAVGKTTLAKKLVCYLKDELGLEAQYNKGLPSLAPSGQAVEQAKARPDADPYEVDKLYLEDLLEDTERITELRKESKKIIVQDRYVPSLRSFCRRYRSGEVRERILTDIDRSQNKLLKPDLVFYLVASSEEKERRLEHKDNVTDFDLISSCDPDLERCLREELESYTVVTIDTTSKGIAGVLHELITNETFQEMITTYSREKRQEEVKG